MLSSVDSTGWDVVLFTVDNSLRVLDTPRGRGIQSITELNQLIFNSFRQLPVSQLLDHL